MLKGWIDYSLELSAHPGDFYSGARKILRHQRLRLKSRQIKNDLRLADAGYTKAKLTQLKKHYVHEESIKVAQELWAQRLEKAKYGSVSFTCFAHFVKGNEVDAKRSRIASVFGPCIQSVVLTYLDDRTTCVDVYYRTTELFKKFPADLVLVRDVLLPKFDFADAPISSLNFFFSNITCHPMYWVTLIPHMANPIEELEWVLGCDQYFHRWIIKWTSAYLVPEYRKGIEKFAQAMRVYKDANERIDEAILKELVPYLRTHRGEL